MPGNDDAARQAAQLAFARTCEQPPKMTHSTSSWLAAGFAVGPNEAAPAAAEAPAAPSATDITQRANQAAARMAAAASSSAQIDARKATEKAAAKKAEPADPADGDSPTHFERAAGSYNTVWSKSRKDSGGWVSGSADEAGPSTVPQSPRLKEVTPNQAVPSLTAATKKHPGSLRKISIVEPPSECPCGSARTPAFERGRSVSGTSSVCSSVGSASSIPEWRREGLGADMIEALERIERDAQAAQAAQAAQQSAAPRKKSLGGLRSSLFGLGRASSTEEVRAAKPSVHRSRSRTSSKDARNRKAEQRRVAAEGSEQPPFLSPRHWEISSPFEVDHTNNSTVGEEFLEAAGS